MQLKDILDICRANEVEHFEYTVVNGDINTTVTGIASDSRKVTDGGIFVCIVGSVSDGHKYIEQVKDKAAVIVVQKGSQYNTEKIPAAVIECDNTRLALACQQHFTAILIRSCLQLELQELRVRQLQLI